MEATDYDIRDFAAHLPEKITEEVVDYVRERVFTFSRYIFTRRQGKQQYGYCTHCQKEFKTERFKHNDRVTCPECWSTCLVRASGISRTRLIDEAYFVWYDRSRLDPNIIVALGIYAVRDYRGNYYRVETQFDNVAMYIFEPGHPRMIKRYSYYSPDKNAFFAGRWEKCRSVYSMYHQGHMGNVPSFYPRNRIKELVKGTPFQYSTWEKYNHEDMTKFFALYAKSPCIEYLTKLGMADLVDDKLKGFNTMGAINWKGKNLLKVLKLSKQEFNEIRQRKLHVSFFLLHILQTSRRLSWNLTITDALDIENWDGYDGYYFKDLVKLASYTPAKRILAYLTKQYTKDKKQYYEKRQVLTTWRDYIEDCKKLEMDLTDEQVLFPKSVYNAHQNTIKQIKIKADEELKRQVKERHKELKKKYQFKYKGFIVRPAGTAEELISEGKALNHCVGTYAQRHAKGETTILFIREAKKPNKPFYTMEVKGDRVIQVRGKNNCDPTTSVFELVEVFKAQKLTKKTKVKVKVPA